jgi:hypothetical protein
MAYARKCPATASDSSLLISSAPRLSCRSMGSCAQTEICGPTASRGKNTKGSGIADRIWDGSRSRACVLRQWFTGTPPTLTRFAGRLRVYAPSAHTALHCSRCTSLRRAGRKTWFSQTEIDAAPILRIPRDRRPLPDWLSHRQRRVSRAAIKVPGTRARHPYFSPPDRGA